MAVVRKEFAVNKNRFLLLPGGVVILGGREKISQFRNDDDMTVNIENFDFVSYNPKTNTTRVISGGQESSFKERYAFVPGRAGCLYFKIKADLEHLALVDAVISDAVKRLDVDQNDVGISLSEIVHNAFQVAESRSSKKDVEIGVLYVPEHTSLILSVTDELGRLNLDDIPSSFEDEKGEVSLLDHGRGLLIISMLMELIAYNPSESGFKEIIIKVPFNGGARG